MRWIRKFFGAVFLDFTNAWKSKDALIAILIALIAALLIGMSAWVIKTKSYIKPGCTSVTDQAAWYLLVCLAVFVFSSLYSIGQALLYGEARKRAKQSGHPLHYADMASTVVAALISLGSGIAGIIMLSEYCV